MPSPASWGPGGADPEADRGQKGPNDDSGCAFERGRRRRRRRCGLPRRRGADDGKREKRWKCEQQQQRVFVCPRLPGRFCYCRRRRSPLGHDVCQLRQATPLLERGGCQGEAAGGDPGRGRQLRPVLKTEGFWVFGVLFGTVFFFFFPIIYFFLPCSLLLLLVHFRDIFVVASPLFFFFLLSQICQKRKKKVYGGVPLERRRERKGGGRKEKFHRVFTVDEVETCFCPRSRRGTERGKRIRFPNPESSQASLSLGSRWRSSDFRPRPAEAEERGEAEGALPSTSTTTTMQYLLIASK